MKSFIFFMRVLNLVNLRQQFGRYQSVEVVELGEFVCVENPPNNCTAYYTIVNGRGLRDILNVCVQCVLGV